MFSNQEVSRILARERVGDQVFGVGFRLRIGTEQALHRMKYGGFPNAAQQLGRWMGKQWRAPPPASVLVPIPSHWRRRLRRGFNPSASLANGLSSVWGLNCDVDCVQRVRHSSSLTSSSRRERACTIESTYVFNELKGCIGPRSLIIVDDVLTTGATYRAVRDVLANEGYTVLGGVWLAMA